MMSIPFLPIGISQSISRLFEITECLATGIGICLLDTVPPVNI